MDPILHTLTTLTWEAAFALVGSTVAIVTGILGYLLKVRSDRQRPGRVKDPLSGFHADLKVALSNMAAIGKQLDDHEHRDEHDFEQVNKKIDKITEILLKILTDGSM